MLVDWLCQHDDVEFFCFIFVVVFRMQNRQDFFSYKMQETSRIVVALFVQLCQQESVEFCFEGKSSKGCYLIFLEQF